MSKTNERHDLIITKLAKCYLKSYSAFSLQPEEVNTMTWDCQKLFLDITVHSELLQKYPVNNEFSKRFFKKLISCIESHQDVHDDYYSFLCSAMENDSIDTFCYRHYIVEDNINKVVTIKETNNMVLNGTTGMRTWEAALMLADWALSNKCLFQNKTVLELGSGVGFTGITIAKFCKIKSILLTDCHSEVLNAIENNITINFPELYNSSVTTGDKSDFKLDTMMLDWNDIANIPNNLIPDILIGADIVYDPLILQPLCNVIQTFFYKNNSLEVFIASTIRNEDTFHSFLQALESNNFKYFKLTHVDSQFIEWDYTSKQMCLLKIVKQ